MDLSKLAPDFKEFLRLLKSHDVKYLLVGGYAVGYHGYPRTTNDLDIWAEVSPENAERLAAVFREFGFSASSVEHLNFLDPDKIFRIGIPPVCIDLMRNASGIEFSAAYSRRLVVEFDELEISLVSLDDLKTNKLASGRFKDLNDLENLP